MKKLRPHPWELPGYHFFVPGFPPGFEPQPFEKKKDYTQAKENLKKGQAVTRARTKARYAAKETA